MRKVTFLILLLLTAPAYAAKATFAGGCFWCMEALFEKVGGVQAVVSGYTAEPSHREVVEVTYDPSKITYGQLLDLYWRNVDPTDATGQFCDKGDEYLAAIFWHDEEQRRLAELSLRNVKKRFANVATEVLPAGAFHEAGAYHQDYYRKNPVRYRFYRAACGRDARLKRLWGRR